MSLSSRVTVPIPLNGVATLASMLESKIGGDSMDPILLGPDFPIPSEQFWIQ